MNVFTGTFPPAPEGEQDPGQTQTCQDNFKRLEAVSNPPGNRTQSDPDPAGRSFEMIDVSGRVLGFRVFLGSTESFGPVKASKHEEGVGRWTGGVCWCARSHRSLVQLHLSVREVRKLFERIDGDQNRTDVGLTGGTQSRTRTGPEPPGPSVPLQCSASPWFQTSELLAFSNSANS